GLFARMLASHPQFLEKNTVYIVPLTGKVLIIIIFESASSLLSVVANQIPYFDISSSNLSRITVAVHFLL
ncbi:MAG: hypothetical protein ACQGQO_11615, partial [Sphaerochaetaceae bacterium]